MNIKIGSEQNFLVHFINTETKKIIIIKHSRDLSQPFKLEWIN